MRGTRLIGLPHAMAEQASRREKDSSSWLQPTHFSDLQAFGPVVDSLTLAPERPTLYSFVVPGGLLLLAALGFLRPRGLPGWMQPIVAVYPYIVLVGGLLFGWYFDRSRMVLAMLTLALADGALQFFAAGDAATQGIGRIVFNAVAFLLPLNLVALSLMTEHGALVRSGVVWLSAALVQWFLVGWICSPELAEVAASLEVAYVDPRWTAWTP